MISEHSEHFSFASYTMRGLIGDQEGDFSENIPAWGQAGLGKVSSFAAVGMQGSEMAITRADTASCDTAALSAAARRG